MNKPFIGHHGHRSSHDPGESWSGSRWATFSISFFKWVATADGKRFKRQSAKYRLKGPVGHRAEMFARADEIVKDLDYGWVPQHKSEALQTKEGK